MHKYKYQVKDASILAPYFCNFIDHYLMPFIPKSIPPNLITIVSNLFVYLALVISFNYDQVPHNSIPPILVGLLLLLYAIGDDMDGLQARRTKKSSPLGEFCDHYLDSLNAGVLLMIYFQMFAINKPYLCYSMWFFACLQYSSTMYEEFKTKWLILDKVGSLEGIFSLIILITLSSIPGIYYTLITPFLFNFNFIELCLAIYSLASFLTVLTIHVRIKKIYLKFVKYLFSHLFISLFAFFYLDLFHSFLLITIYNSLYVTKVLGAHLSNLDDPSCDLLVPFALLIYLLIIYSGIDTFPINFLDNFLLVIICYLFLLFFYTTIKVVRSLYKIGP